MCDGMLTPWQPTESEPLVCPQCAKPLPLPGRLRVNQSFLCQRCGSLFTGGKISDRLSSWYRRVPCSNCAKRRELGQK